MIGKPHNFIFIDNKIEYEKDHFKDNAKIK